MLPLMGRKPARLYSPHKMRVHGGDGDRKVQRLHDDQVLQRLAYEVKEIGGV